MLSLIVCLAGSPAVALLFDEESYQGDGHGDDADEGQDSWRSEDAEEKEYASDQDEQHADAAGRF
ncbi:MAG: hypothetical protein ABL952_15290 [Pyrinomonadaceae bacterium]